MELKTKNNLLMGLVVLLLVVCAVEGFFIYRHGNEKFNVSNEMNFDSFSSQLRNQMQNNRKDNWELFDRFFDDNFFSSQKDPFHEMERLHKRMNEMMEKEMKGALDHSWESWFGDRFLGKSSDMEMQTTEKGNDYIIKLKIPNLKDNRFNIKIDKDGLSVDGDYTQTAEKKDSQGNVVSKEEVHRSLSRKFSLPPDADYERAKVDNQTDEIIITLPKLARG